MRVDMAARRIVRLRVCLKGDTVPLKKTCGRTKRVMEYHLHTRELFEILFWFILWKVTQNAWAGFSSPEGWRLLVFEVQKEVQICDGLELMRTLHILFQERFAAFELICGVIVRESIRLFTFWTEVHRDNDPGGLHHGQI
jgi:hypothetical protein